MTAGGHRLTGALLEEIAFWLMMYSSQHGRPDETPTRYSVIRGNTMSLVYFSRLPACVLLSSGRTRGQVLQWLSIGIAVILLGTGVSRADLVGWWQFDDVVGDTVPDRSGFMNDGTLMNGATISSDVPDFLGAGSSLSLDGGDQHVLVPHNTSLDIPSELTIAAWVKPIGNQAWDGIVAKSPSDGSAANQAGNYELRIENGSRSLTFHHQQGGDNDTVAYPGGPPIADSTWQHVATTVNSSGVNFFLDGQPAGSYPLGGIMSFGATNTNPLYIGSRADLFTTMNGLIDDLRIYNEVLSAEAIRDLAGASDPPADLVTATIFSVSSQLATNFNRGAQNLVNGSGLTADGFHSITPDGTMWLNAGNGCCGDAADPLQPGAEVTFDLGSVVKLDRMKIWNYNETLPDRTDLLGRGARIADVSVSDDGSSFSLLLEDLELTMAPGTTDVDFGQIVDLQGTEAQYVKLTLKDNFDIGDNDFIGLSEVQFYQVPEPNSVLLLMIGCLALLRDRRRR